MRKLLIGEHSAAVIKDLKRVFRHSWDVHIETDGYAVCDSVKTIQPDAMILDLKLSGKNGLQILEELFPNIPPVVLVLTDYTSPYILQTVESFGVGCVLSFPISSDYVKNLIDDMYNAHLSPPSKTNRHLTALGIDGRLSGYRCLSAAIVNYSKNHTKLLKEIYPETAKECGLNDARCVEHTIRSAIYKAWLKRDIGVWSHYFPTNQNGDVELPTNKEFILSIERCI